MCLDCDKPTMLGRKFRKRSFALPILTTGLVSIFGNLVAPQVNLPTWQRVVLGIAITAILGIGGWSFAVGERYKGTTTAWLFSYGIWAGQWITSIWIAGSREAWIWIELAIFGLAFTVLWPAVRDFQIEHERKMCRLRRYGVRGNLVEPKRRRPVYHVYKEEESLIRAGVKGLQQYSERIATPSGFALHLGPCDRELPTAELGKPAPRCVCGTDHSSADVTFESLRGKIDAIEAAFSRMLGGLRPGSVRVERAVSEDGTFRLSHEFYVYVDVRDILAERVDFIKDHAPMSVYDVFTVGYFIDGEPIQLTLDEIHVMVIGATGSGKSNFIQILLFLLSRCIDVKLVVIDGKGGATIRRWLEAWIDGRAARSVLDWVAVDRFEAERIVRALIDLIKDRPARRRGSKWRATPTSPAVMLIVEEFADIAGAHSGPAVSTDEDGATSGEFQKLFTTISTQGRSEGIWTVRSTQRSTVSMAGNGDDQANNRGRIVFPVSATRDASQALAGESDVHLSRMAASMTHPGSVFVRGLKGADRDTPGRVFFFGDDEEHDDTIIEASILHANIPPAEWDPGDLVVLNRWGYEDRWDSETRFAWYWGVPPKEPPRRPVLLGQSKPAPTGPAAPMSAPTGAPGPMARALMDSMRRRTGSAPAAAQPAAAKPVVDAEAWLGITKDLDDVAEIGRQLGFGDGDAPASDRPADPAPSIQVPSFVGKHQLDGPIVAELEEAGTAGATGAQIAGALIGKHVITDEQRTTVYPRLKSLLSDGVITTPNPDIRSPRYYLPKYWN